MYTYSDAEYLKEYYREKVVGQLADSSKSQHERIKEVREIKLGDGYEVGGFITNGAYLHIDKVAKNLELISPSEVLKNSGK